MSDPFKGALRKMSTCPTCSNDLVCHDQGECLRPTPETDAAARKGAYLTHGEYPETCGKQIVHIDFARRLERQRNEAREENARLQNENVVLRAQLSAAESVVSNTVWHKKS